MGAGVEIAMGLSLGAKFSNLVNQIEDRNSFDKMLISIKLTSKEKQA